MSSVASDFGLGEYSPNGGFSNRSNEAVVDSDSYAEYLLDVMCRNGFAYSIGDRPYMDGIKYCAACIQKLELVQHAETVYIHEIGFREAFIEADQRCALCNGHLINLQLAETCEYCIAAYEEHGTYIVGHDMILPVSDAERFIRNDFTVQLDHENPNLEFVSTVIES